MSQLNSPSLKGLLKHLESQGRASDFRTRKSIYDLKGLNKRLGPYRGAESQNFALGNIIKREDETDVRLMKSKTGQKHVFDVPGGSMHTGTGDPITAQQTAVKNVNPIDATGRIQSLIGAPQGITDYTPYGLSLGQEMFLPGTQIRGQQTSYRGTLLPFFKEAGTN